MSETAIQYFESPSVNQEYRKPKFKTFWREDARQNAFTQSDLVSTQDEEAQDLIHQIRKLSVFPNQERMEMIANRLAELFNFAKEENPARPGISVNSLGNFFAFLTLYTNMRTPNLSLSPDHNIYASWRKAKRVFSAHFLVDGDIRFVLFTPNQRHPRRRIRVSGTVTGDSLMKIIAPENLSDWVMDER